MKLERISKQEAEDKGFSMDKNLEVKIRKNILKDLGMLPQVANDKKLYYSENNGQNFRGMLYWVNNHKLLVNLVNKFEKEFNASVYHCILNYTNCGTMFTLLYVSNDESSWEMDRKDLIDGEPLAYVYNLGDLLEFDSTDDIDIDYLITDMGTVGIVSVNGGFDRIY